VTEADLFTPLLALGVRYTLVLGVALFIVSLGRAIWINVSGHD
jgi:hypothetical protein